MKSTGFALTVKRRTGTHARSEPDLILRHSSYPSIPGITTSLSTRSQLPAVKAASPLGPSRATATSNPSDCSSLLSLMACVRVSSTTRIRYRCCGGGEMVRTVRSRHVRTTGISRAQDVGQKCREVKRRCPTPRSCSVA